MEGLGEREALGRRRELKERGRVTGREETLIHEFLEASALREGMETTCPSR